MYRIAVIPGDGVGREVVREGLKVLEAVGEVENIEFDFVEYPFGGQHYIRTGELVPGDALEEIKRMKAIFFGSVGDPRVKPGVLEQGILLKIRFYYDQYINLRPVKLYPSIECPLRGERDIDFYVVRENTEDFYVGIGDRFKGRKSKAELDVLRELYNLKFNIDVENDGSEEIAYQIGVISKEGAKRVIEYAFELAIARDKKKVTSVDKANVLTHIYSLWRDVFEDVAGGYPEVETEYTFVDAITMFFLSRPEQYKVVVTPNMFGDIITDLGAQIQGGIGLASSGNINPTGVSMFEPVHGSAPDIAGKGIVNPIAQIMAGALMLQSLGEDRAGTLIEKSVEEVLRERKFRTPDLGGNSSTEEMGNVIAEKVKELGR
ncbi:MAG TPA: isocitrate/isopropylmalate dehydrogenase family protein [Euryarchaeota archaeon]|nr:D-malate dehydrogenase [decarboxylating] [archaeon BMS3Bbin15]HDL15030.1 isocitrate/isopropylmalate dehydrogenase family protein [Euryarchaeota archaeon]